MSRPERVEGFEGVLDMLVISNIFGAGRRSGLLRVPELVADSRVGIGGYCYVLRRYTLPISCFLDVHRDHRSHPDDTQDRVLCSMHRSLLAQTTLPQLPRRRKTAVEEVARIRWSVGGGTYHPNAGFDGATETAIRHCHCRSCQEASQHSMVGSGSEVTVLASVGGRRFSSRALRKSRACGRKMRTLISSRAHEGDQKSDCLIASLSRQRWRL
jgi:hypothetical protein